MATAELLIVDDNPKNLQVLGSVLKQNGYKVEFATNGHNALNWVDKRKFDLILLDIMMPEVDGYEICRQLKDQDHSNEIPVIFITAKTDIDSIVEGFEAGGVDYITKPFNQKELLARVSTQLSLKNALQELKEKNQSITDSITYAEKIQSAMQEDNSILKNALVDHFIFYKPRDIVSGDFIWTRINGSEVIIAVADCTGHGVPGALMSILGMSALNQLGTRKFDKSGITLNLLRDRIKASLHQEDGSITAQDGLDISLCIIDMQKKELEFAGAFQSLYIIRDKELIEIKGDSQPVGIYLVEKDFNTRDIKLEEGDCLYMFSDGYPDQIGGPKEKKFMKKRFRELLLTIHSKPFKDQHTILDLTLKDWMGEFPQVDDITVLGLKV